MKQDINTHDPVGIHDLLAHQREIAIVWSIEDVQEVRSDLSPEQAWQVLTLAKRHHDATIGINWEVLECHAQFLFGDAPETDETEEELP